MSHCCSTVPRPSRSSECIPAPISLCINKWKHKQATISKKHSIRRRIETLHSIARAASFRHHSYFLCRRMLYTLQQLKSSYSAGQIECPKGLCQLTGRAIAWRIYVTLCAKAGHG